MKRIGIDMDGVIADLHLEWVNRYNRDYSDNLKPSDIINWNWHTLVKIECGSKIYDYLDDPSIFENLPIIKNSQYVIRELSKFYELFIITSPWNPESIPAKYRWLLKNFKFIDRKNYVFTGNKSISNVDYLIDDKAENFIDLDGQGILFDAPHNQNQVDFPRVKNWLDVARFFEII
jgi:5'-nucleotidase